jgi:hypothetical protein
MHFGPVPIVVLIEGILLYLKFTSLLLRYLFFGSYFTS